MLIFFQWGQHLSEVLALHVRRGQNSRRRSQVGDFKKNIPVLRGVVHTAESDGTEGEGNKNW